MPSYYSIEVCSGFVCIFGSHNIEFVKGDFDIVFVDFIVYEVVNKGFEGLFLFCSVVSGGYIPPYLRAVLAESSDFFLRGR